MPWSASVFNQVIIQGTASGVFIYNGAPAGGTLIGSWASQGGTDPYGNTYNQGINVKSGVLSGVAINQATLVGATILNALSQGETLTNANITGGTMTETTINFDSNGGDLFAYSSTTTSTILTPASGSTYTPTITGTALIECWGADAGGDGGTALTGGQGGGGGEYAAESVPLTNGVAVPITIGTGGTGGTTNNPGTNGGDVSFNNNQVFANGGDAGVNFTGGIGGTGSTNSTHWNGGNGGNSGGTASAGGGGRAGSTGPGGAGGDSAGTTPGAAGTAGTGTGGHAGGAGVAPAVNGNPGGGGSGAGASSGTTNQTLHYDPTSTDSYYGSGVGGGHENHNGVMLQGNPNTPLNQFPGDQESFANYDGLQMGLDWSGWTIDSIKLTVTNQHSWYNSGMYLILGKVIGSTNSFNLQTHWTPEAQVTGPFSIIGSVTAANIQSGNFRALIFGPSGSTGNATSLYNYGYYTGGTAQGAPRITISGHQGAGIETAGNGADGQIKVTFQSAPVLVAGITGGSVNITDPTGAQIAPGYTGPTHAFHPGSSPPIPETAQTLPITATFAVRSGYDSIYWIDSEGIVHIEAQLTCSTSGNPAVTTALPVGYRPPKPKASIIGANTSGAASGTPPSVEMSTGGVLTAFNLVATTSLIQISYSYSTRY